MQDIRLRLEPQHNTAAFTNSPAEATSSAATLVNAEAALIETGERKGSAEGSPLVQLLPELSFR